MRFLKSGFPRVCALAFSPDGRTLVAAGDAFFIDFRDLITLEGHSKGGLADSTMRIRGLAFSDDGQFLAIAERGGLFVFDSRFDKQVRDPSHVTHSLGPMIFRAPGKPVWSVGQDSGPMGHPHRAWLNDLEAGHAVAELAGVAPVRAAAFHPAGDRLLTFGRNGLAELDLKPIIRSAEEPAERPRLSLYQRARAIIRALRTEPTPPPVLHHRAVQPVPFAGAFRMTFTPDGGCLLVNRQERQGCKTGWVGLWDLAAARWRAEWEWPVGPVCSLAVSPDGLIAAAGSTTGQIVLWDLEG